MWKDMYVIFMYAVNLRVRLRAPFAGGPWQIRVAAAHCTFHDPSHFHLHICDTGGRRPIGCRKLQVIFCKRATNYKALLRKMTCKNKASYASLPPCRHRRTFHYPSRFAADEGVLYTHRHTHIHTHMHNSHFEYLFPHFLYHAIPH